MQEGACSYRRDHEAGFTLAELVFALVVMVLGTSVLIGHLAITYRQNRSQRDRVFAFMVARSILAEIQAIATEGEDNGTNDINDLDDGASLNPVLTLARSGNAPVAPDHELSGNRERDGDWVWSRQITVRPLPGIDNRKIRYVSVRVLKLGSDGKRTEVANLSSVVNSLAESFPPSQVFDVFLLAIENIPGWWVHMESIRPFTEAMVADLERNNPGLRIRTHWITKASYGRNAIYRPYINMHVDSLAAPDGVYYYPGLMPTGSASTYYYVSGAIDARMLTDAGEVNGYDATLNPLPYALADFFNHGMRLPAERAFHEARVQAVRARKAAIAAAIAASTPSPPELWDMSEEPTYRLLLEDMCTDPDRYRHALIVNLHGELVPMPSIRNYSDAAKSPATLPGVRVVTHPEELRTARDPGGTAHDDAVFRVYAWTTDPDSHAGPAVLGASQAILLQVMGVDLVDDATGLLLPAATLENLAGGVPVGGSSDYRPFAPSKGYTDTLVADEMHYRAEFVDPGAGLEKYTLITLYNTPVVAPQVVHSVTGDLQGVANNDRARLYDMEYVPCPTGATADFAHDLAAAGTGPKNTARWRLRISGAALGGNHFIDPDGNRYDPADDVRLTVRTRIHSTAMGPWSETGSAFPVLNEPDNLSETYTWWADSADDVPFTERSQFLGDPRHCPYKDVAHGDADFPDGYNWCFDSLRNTVDVTGDYPGLDAAHLRNRWQGYLRQDVGRYFELLRTALVRSGALYTTLTGWSYYYMGHGAEIGYDAANGYPSSIPTDLTAFSGAGNGYVDNITGGRRYVRSHGTSYWWGMPWLGELCPDTHHASQWLALDAGGKVRGNLDAGTGSGRFRQDLQQTVYAGSRNVTAGTALLTAVQRLKSTGCGMFFNTGTSSSTFNHTGSSGNGSLVGPGLEIGANYNFALPASTSVTRPFSLGATNSPDGWDLPPYASNRYTTSLIRTYYTAPVSGWTGSGLVELRHPTGTSSAYVVVNGLAQTTALGTGALAQFSMLSLVHSFFEVGDTALTNRIALTPRVELAYPTEITELVAPATVDLKYDVEWRRWDRAAYTETISATLPESESDLDYFLLYSRDNGETWQSVVDDGPVQPGHRPSNASQLVPDFGAGPEVYTWPTPPAQFPAGSYIVRVEVHRRGQSLHYANHQQRIFIDR